MTRKDHVAMRAEPSRKRGLRGGKNADAPHSSTGELSKTFPDMNDWAGADKGKYSHLEMTKRLDQLRQRRR